MFDGFEDAKDEQARKRWFASAGTSIVIYGLVGVGILLLARQQVEKAAAEPELDVTFRAQAPEPEVAKPPPPPPPPPPKAAGPRPKRPGKVAPVQPKVIPEARPQEGDPGAGRHDGAVAEEYGDGLELGGGDEVAAAPPPPPPPPPPPKVARDPDPIDEIDPSVTRAQALSSNAPPAYPEQARHQGRQAEVILEIRISSRGDVVDVEVLRGDEPFASAAVAAVKTWRYRPATVDGKPVAVVKKLKIPFRIRT